MSDTTPAPLRTVTANPIAVLLVANMVDLICRLSRPGPLTSYGAFVISVQAVLCVLTAALLAAAAWSAWVATAPAGARAEPEPAPLAHRRVPALAVRVACSRTRWRGVIVRPGRRKPG